MNLQVRIAHQRDLNSISNLLKESDLPYQDIKTFLNSFIVLIYQNSVIGCAGLELFDKYALLRSVAVYQGSRSKGYGKILVKKIIKFAREKKVSQLFLLTETASDYFPIFGFEKISRNEIPHAVKSSKEFTTYCPATAIAMRAKI
jgi:amino-acid N-acetyltransferase